MKKLMVMLASVATAFGLFAEGGAQTPTYWVTGSALESTAWAGPEIDDESQGAWWNLAASTSMTATAYGATTKPTRVWPFDSEEEEGGEEKKIESFQNDFAAIKTQVGAGAPVERYVKVGGDSMEVATSIYFDGQVKFTAFDQDPEGTYENEKIALWLRDYTEDDTPVAATNLIVRVGENKYEFADIVAVDEWTHLTIKAIKMTANQLGFVIFVNGHALTKTGIDFTDITVTEPAAIAYKALNQLFPSAVANDATITAVAFDGQGAIDDVCFTDRELQTTPASATILWTAANVENVSITAVGAQQIPVEGGMTLVFADGAVAPMTISWTGKGSYMDGPTTITKDDLTNGEFDLDSALVEAEADFGGKMTLADAITAANESTTNGTLKLLKGAGAITIENTSAAVITLDLNGQTVIQASGIEANPAIMINDGSLMIVDNSQGAAGWVKANSDESATAVAAYGGSCVIASGKFDGPIVGASITGGKFSEDPSACVASGYTAVAPIDPETYWTVVPAYTATFKVDAETVDTQVDVLTATNVAASKAGYIFNGWKVGGEGEIVTFPYALTADTTFIADFTADSYTIRFISGEGELTTNDLQKAYNATIEDNDIPTPAAVTGKSFQAWNPAVVSTVVGDAEYTALYTANVYTVTFDSKGGSTVESQTVEYGANATEPTPAPTKTDSTFGGWFTDDETFAEEFDFSTAIMADTTLFAKWDSAAPTPVPVDDKIVYTGIKAADADAACDAVQIKSPDTAVVADNDYADYFNKSAVETDTGVFTVTATLKPEITQAVEETKELAAELNAIAAADKATSVTIPAAKVKPGLWYSLKQGSALANRTEGTRVQAQGGSVTLTADHYDGSGFYQIMVNTAPQLTE